MKINKISTYRIRLSAEDVDSIRDKKTNFCYTKAGFKKCSRMESNHHGISPTRPSSVRVYQFRHVSFKDYKYTALLVETATVLQ